MDFDKASKQAEERILETIEQIQDATIRTVSYVSERVGGVLPPLPTQTMADRLPATPEQLVNAGFGLAEKVVRANKKGTLAVLKALEPIREKVGVAATNGTTTATKKTTRKPASKTRASA